MPLKIVFLSSHNRYLEHELYLAIAGYLGDFENVYFESDYSDKIKFHYNKGCDFRDKNTVFDSYEFIAPIRTPAAYRSTFRNKVGNRLKEIKQLKGWKKIFLKKIDEIKPDAVIFTSPREYNAKLLGYFRPLIPKIYIQHGYLLSEIPIKTFKEHFNINIYNKLLRLPIYGESSYPPFEDKKTHYLMWAPIWTNKIDKSEYKISFVGSIKNNNISPNLSISKPSSKSLRVLIYLNKRSYIGQRGWDQYVLFYNDLLKFSPSISFTLKVHPMEDLQYCKERFPTANVIKEKVNPEEFNIVLGHWSTACCVAITRGVPTILINPDNQFDFHLFRLANYGAFAYSPSDVLNWIDKFSSKDLFNQIRTNFIREQLGYDDGKYLERLKNTVLNILIENNNKLNI